MKIIFSEYARQELEDAAAYLDPQVPGLGGRFRTEVRLASSRIARHPSAWSVESGEVRKYLLHKFPYKLLYSIETDHLFIIAVAHQHRMPDYWVDRLS